jgi:hypothetical protein
MKKKEMYVKTNSFYYNAVKVRIVYTLHAKLRSGIVTFILPQPPPPLLFYYYIKKNQVFSFSQ